MALTYYNVCLVYELVSGCCVNDGVPVKDLAFEGITLLEMLPASKTDPCEMD